MNQILIFEILPPFFFNLPYTNYYLDETLSSMLHVYVYVLNSCGAG